MHPYADIGLEGGGPEHAPFLHGSGRPRVPSRQPPMLPPGHAKKAQLAPSRTSRPRISRGRAHALTRDARLSWCLSARTLTARTRPGRPSIATQIHPRSPALRWTRSW